MYTTTRVSEKQVGRCLSSSEGYSHILQLQIVGIGEPPGPVRSEVLTVFISNLLLHKRLSCLV